MPRYTVEELENLVNSREYITKLHICGEVMLKDGQKLFDILKLFQDLKELYFERDSEDVETMCDFENIDLTVFPKLEKFNLEHYYTTIIFSPSLKELTLPYAAENIDLSMCSELEILDFGNLFVSEKFNMPNLKYLNFLKIRYDDEIKLEISELENLKKLILISECQTKWDFDGLKKLKCCKVMTNRQYNKECDERMRKQMEYEYELWS